jgi:sigma-B regulation protein RsbU (phosphoserine phosphatase)
MEANGAPAILVCAGRASAAEELRRLLAADGYESTPHLLGAAEPPNAGRYRAVVVDGSHCGAAALELCRRLRGPADEGFVPLVFIAEGGDPETRQAGLEAGADACLQRPLAPRELRAQVRALLRLKDAHDGLAGRAALVHRAHARLRQLHHQLDHELRLARRIQASLLPQALPQVPGVRFALHHAPRGRVGGDFYDAFRLDEDHVGLYVADATGHGVPAGLLTLLARKALRAKEVFGRQYRLLPPDEVLRRLNRELIEQELPDDPFITMAYGLLNHREGTLSLARAGSPYPLCVPAHGPVELWRQEGLLLGVADAHFPARTCPLRSGDKVLLYSDGIDGARLEGQAPGVPSLAACAERHRRLPVEEFVARLACELFAGAAAPDDLTLLGLEMGE